MYECMYVCIHILYLYCIYVLGEGNKVYVCTNIYLLQNSHTARHLAEFWMIEPEICFAELVDDMALAVSCTYIHTVYTLEF